MDPSGAPAHDPAAEAWANLDAPWQEAFRQAWAAFLAGSLPVGAVASTPDGEIVHASRNRIADSDGPVGEIFGSALAHAEMNVLARLKFRTSRGLVVTTTLEPCLQCAAAIRLGPVSIVRFAGADRYWDGCHDFGKLSAREATRGQVERIGPRDDEIGLFATVISRIGGLGLTEHYAAALRELGDGPIVDFALRLESDGVVDGLREVEVDEALAKLWPDLQELRGA